MKKGAAIFFLVLYLLNATDIGQLLKLPAFVTHYTEHRQADKDMTLWQFISIHYAQGDVQDADHDKDMKLPFKTHDHCCGFQVCIATPPEPIIFTADRLPYFPARKKYYTADANLTASFLSQIWQPPKAC